VPLNGSTRLVSCDAAASLLQKLCGSRADSPLALVADIGTYAARIGLAGDAAPRMRVPTVRDAPPS